MDFEVHIGKLPKRTHRLIPGHHFWHNGKPSYSAEYISWYSMLIRCYRRTHKSYVAYGERNILVWNAFVGPDGFYNWLEWMGPRPQLGDTVNRLDHTGNYIPGNMEWADKKTQSRERGIQCNNTSGYRGVYLNKSSMRWRSKINRMSLGTFPTREEAALAYNEAALKFHGKSAQLNMIPSELSHVG